MANDKDPELKELWVKAHENKRKDQADKDKKELDLKREQKLKEHVQKNYEKRKVTDDYSGQETTKEELSKKSADRLINTGAESYNTFTSTMLALMNSFEKMRANLAQKRSELLDVHVEVAGLKAFHKGSDFIKEKYKQIKGEKPLTLSDMIWNVEMKEDNTLDITSIEQENEVDMGVDKGKLDNHFKMGVQMWLAKEGYTPITADGKTTYQNEDGEVLTPERFNELREEHFEDFLAGRFEDVNMKPRNTM